MGRAPCCDKANVKRGPWSPEEDMVLRSYLERHGTGGNWIALPQKAGLKCCGKSYRLRWLNYLRPDIKHGDDGVRGGSSPPATSSFLGPAGTSGSSSRNPSSPLHLTQRRALLLPCHNHRLLPLPRTREKPRRALQCPIRPSSSPWPTPTFPAAHRRLHGRSGLPAPIGRGPCPGFAKHMPDLTAVTAPLSPLRSHPSQALLR